MADVQGYFWETRTRSQLADQSEFRPPSESRESISGNFTKKCPTKTPFLTARNAGQDPPSPPSRCYRCRCWHSPGDRPGGHEPKQGFIARGMTP
jgi:hypothetical protein